MIIAFGGRIACGKSVVSSVVAERLGCSRVTFGDVVRAEAGRRGVPETRRTLQDLGDEMVKAGWDEFCRRCVSQVHWDRQVPLVVDGVRHVGAVEALTRVAAPAPLFLVFIAAPWARRLEWLALRGVGEAEVHEADAHQNEQEVPAVEARADLVIANTRTVEAAADQIIAELPRP